MEIKKRIVWLDLEKGVAILAMVAGHVSLLPWDPVRKLIFSFHMPLFFILSGFTTKETVGSLREAVKKYARQLLFPYLCIAVLASVILLFKNGITAQALLNEALRIVCGSGVPADYGPGRPIFLDSLPVVGAIWFLPAMFWCKTVFAVILKITQNRGEWLRALICTLLTALGYGIGQRWKLPLGIDIALFALGFLYVGFLLRRYDLMRRVNASWACAAAGLWYLGFRANAIELSARLYRDFPWCIFAFLGAVGGTVVIGKICEEMLDKIPILRQVLSYAGKRSLYILAAHHLESYCVDWNLIAQKIPLSSFGQGLVIAALRIALALLLAWCYDKFYTWLKGRIARKRPADKKAAV